MTAENTYDDIPYESHAFSETHPAHLYTLAKLYGLTPTPIENALVLELGCASGGNIIPMAYHCPQTHFVGIDLSGAQIAFGLQQINALGLKNIILRQQGIEDFKENQKYDYIICHGVYSWVNSLTRTKIFELCATHLQPNGIVYLSYNTFPGWAVGNIVKEMMVWHTSAIQNSRKKAKEAKNLLQFMYGAMENNPYGALMLQEMDVIANHSVGQVIHEHLTTDNNAFYFYQFMKKAAQYQFVFVCEAFLTNMPSANLFLPLRQDKLNQENIITLSQYQDFIVNQRFRSTLLGWSSVRPCYQIDPHLIEQFYLEINPSHALGQIEDDPLLNEALSILKQQAESLQYHELYQHLLDRHLFNDLSRSRQILNEKLLRAVFKGWLHISSHNVDYAHQVTAKPRASPLAIFQAQQQDQVTNCRHENIRLTPVAQIILPYLDGVHDLAALVHIVAQHINEGILVMLGKDNQEIKDPAVMQQHITAQVEQTLTLLSQRALLIK